MFVDKIEITVKAGDGGGGIVSFLREKRRPRGGPAGGDGGRGGDVVFKATRSKSTLFSLSHYRRLDAGNGMPGGRKNMTGKSADALVLRVPVGTILRHACTGEMIADLAQEGAAFTAARGGRGGRGNQHFATSTNRTPRYAEDGRPGEEIALKLELKLIAHVGLVGLPNAGKSSLLARISAAHPRVADYPFTTREPQLGIVDTGDYRQVVVADIPGLIEGAHRGAGLGDAFLQHIERTLMLVHMVDSCPMDETDPGEALAAVDKELAAYSPELAAKPRIVAANKMDLPGAGRGAEKLRHAAGDLEVYEISALTGDGVKALMGRVIQILKEMPEFHA